MNFPEEEDDEEYQPSKEELEVCLTVLIAILERGLLAMLLVKNTVYTKTETVLKQSTLVSSSCVFLTLS